MKITSIDKNVCKALRVKLNKVLEESGIEGITFEVGNMKFTSESVEIKLTAKTENAAKEDISHLKYMATLTGINEIENDKYEIIEYRSRSPKFPWIVKNKQDNKLYKMQDDRLKQVFK